MEFRILGSLDVTHDGRAVPIAGGRQRALLALLVLERNTPVSGERIVEELWNGRAPPTAPKVVQNLVSQLRRSLGGEDVLRTRGHAYELVVPDEALDAAQFERLLEDGRQALAHGDAGRAAGLLREALGLWRGPALGELAEEMWARAEAGRLEERRLVAFERRVEADLALGLHADLVAELETAVGREPLREGLRAQLMLALYRSGRQAEALEAYQGARRVLVGELGIEPGPELRRLHGSILEQDPALESPPAPRRAARSPAPRRRRAGALLLGGGVALAAAAAAGAILLIGEHSVAPAAAGGEAVAVDMATGRIERRIPAGRAPAVIAAGGGRLWMVDVESRTLIGLDPGSETVDTLATGATPIDVAAAGDDVWVTNGTRRERTAEIGTVASELVRLDASARRQEAAVPLPAGDAHAALAEVGRLAVAPGTVWTVAADGSVLGIDPEAAAITRSATSFRALAIAYGEAGLWAAADNGRLVELDSRTARVRRRVTLPTEEIAALAVGDAVWVASWGDGKLWRVDRDEDAVPRSVTVGTGVTDVVAAAGGIWLANPLDGTVTQVDPVTMRVERTVGVGGLPRSLTVDGGTLWVAVTGTGGPATSEVAGVAPLPASICEPVVAGPGGKADVLVVSDMPLQGDARLTATQMAHAITFVLREHGFRAGRLRIAYQSCDDSLAATGSSDEAKCASNGRAYGRDRDVVAVIGSFYSACTFELLPVLNRAAGGAVGIVSPVNSGIALTRGPPEVDLPTDLSELYPTGKRHYVRVYPADDLQAAAAAQFARDRGRRRVFVLDDGEAYYSVVLGDGFEAAARKLGLDIAGRATWRSKARSYAGLAERVAESGADAVYIAATPITDGGAVVRALRSRLGREVDVTAADGLAPPSFLLEAAGARAARGVFLTTSTQVVERLPPEGRAFIERFARTQPGTTVEAYAAYAAQATEVLLAALARSDGTRASVIKQLFAVRMNDGLLGDIAFDVRGDLTRAPISVLRVVGGDTSPNLASAEGAVVERVLHPSTELLER